ncbi:hypothetical protein GJ496_000825 [Pomphorhynchus laevis]|nr:hypothetical protein GJ496_000825 [Pomphorhynchus laevis]
MSTLNDLESLDTNTLRNILRIQRQLLSNHSVIERLSDKGARINEIIRELEQVICSKEECEVSRDFTNKLSLDNSSPKPECDTSQTPSVIQLKQRSIYQSNNKIEVMSAADSLNAAYNHSMKDLNQDELPNRGYTYDDILNSVQRLSTDSDDDSSDISDNDSYDACIEDLIMEN